MGLFETDLMDPYRNRYLLAFLHLLNQTESKKLLDSMQYAITLQQCIDAENRYSDELIDGLIAAAVDSGLLKNEQKKLCKTCESALLPPVSLVEKIYLKNILQSSYAPLFLDADTIQFLLSELADVLDMKFSEIVAFCGTESEPEFSDAYVRNFRQLIEAIQKKCMIRFVNRAHNGNTYQNQAFPVKIEFSVIHRKFWLSLWHIEQKRPFKADIERITDIELLEEISENEYHETIRMMEKRKEPQPIVMEIKDYKNARERANLQFSMYQRKVKIIDDDTVQMSVYYYSFDRDELLDAIMMFGPAIRVTGPTLIVEEIRNRLRLTK